jgi:membrane protein DedA with SNARE-associated domain
MRVLLQILGVAALLVGLLWIGQGLGLVMWPSSSFMLDQRIWALYGIILAVLGAALLWRAGRTRR